jgi:hypothetical protein
MQSLMQMGELEASLSLLEVGAIDLDPCSLKAALYMTSCFYFLCIKLFK